MNTSLPTGTVTFLFTDIVGSTPLWEQEPEKMAATLQIHNTALRQAIEANDGAVFKIVGDAFQAAFPTAPLALKAAIEGQRALQAAPWNELGELKVRMGLHTGEAELDPGGDEYAVSHTKNRAARIMSVAHGGQVLLSQETKDLVDHQLPESVTLKDLGEQRLKGIAVPERLYQVVAPMLADDFPPLGTETRIRHNLPLEMTSFIGREKEVTQVKELLNQYRMVTLTGSGGVGKTRLSIRVAEEMLDECPDGLWYIELALLTDPNLVFQIVAQTIGLSEFTQRSHQDVLVSFLRSRKVLIVLDNCEHLLSACAQLADTLLKDCPDVKLLTSSREALGVAGETPFIVPALGLPKSDEVSVETLNESEAVRLFVNRVRISLPDFHVVSENAQSIAKICRRLDGIPLALELAAPRLKMLTTEQLVARLDNAFRLLTGGSRSVLPRQQTLRATIDWSYQLLNEKERTLLHRLSVFSGGWTLEGAEQVCAWAGLEDWEIFDLLASLVDKSIVTIDRRQGHEIRYRLLEIVRQFAKEKMDDTGEGEQLCNRHLAYYVTFTEEAYPHLHGAGRLVWTSKMKREYDNIRDALDWASRDPIKAVKGLQIAVSINSRYWFPLGKHREGTQWIKTLLQTAGDELPKLLKAKSLLGLTRMKLPSNYEETRRAYEQCINLCKEIGPEADRVLCLALIWNYQSLDYESALTQLAEAVQIARGTRFKDSWELGEALYFYSLLLLNHPRGAYDDQALAAAYESKEVFQKGDRWHVGSFWLIGAIHQLRDEGNLARQSFETAYKIIIQEDNVFATQVSLEYLSWHHRLAGDYKLAYHYCQKLFTTVDSAAYESGYVSFAYSSGLLICCLLNHAETNWDQKVGLDCVSLLGAISKFRSHEAFTGRRTWGDMLELEKLRSRLGSEVYDNAWESGKALTLDEAVIFAGSLLEKYVPRSIRMIEGIVQ